MREPFDSEAPTLHSGKRVCWNFCAPEGLQPFRSSRAAVVRESNDWLRRESAAAASAISVSVSPGRSAEAGLVGFVECGFCSWPRDEKPESWRGEMSYPRHTAN
uniref:U6 snRNA-associated Sm-like protein LSm6 isoform X1 n=1 Tax=Camelus bactrianus TaxID=9837 RepID=A0A9W3G598_CAMBA|nr:U6 snRNA-associated Sm-like protein LSm6 isoform X1 [Camelus bactrianus]